MNVHVPIPEGPPAEPEPTPAVTPCGPSCTTTGRRRMAVDPRTRARQARASQPERSAWVSANAGSGKTHVLKQRVLRLLLEGVAPARILCLTYTKLAAAEMANRVFSELADWATLCDCRLTEEILALEGIDLSEATPDVAEQARLGASLKLSRARTLFARALETPGGLKIQTIHSFCEAILHQFPLEANVPARFAVVEDERRAELMREARDAMWIAARAGDDDRLTGAADAAMRYGSDHAVAEALDEVIARRELVAPFLRATGGARDAAAELRRRFELGNASPDEMKVAFWDSCTLDRDALRRFVRRALDTGTAENVKFARRLEDALASDDPAACFDACCDAFLTADHEPRKRIVTGKSWSDEELDDLTFHADEVHAMRSEIAMLDVIEGSAALFALADDLMRRYAEAKRDAGLLDFDDIIARTADLLEREGAGAWVHYKLDRGLHHVLVDEAQDTSPRQWRIVGRLVDEFFSGEGVYEDGALDDTGLPRTVFAVGDEKQSIFSFQGAQPAAFEEQRRRFATVALNEIDDEGDFDPVPLTLSFRSVQDVLDAVDTVFADPSNAEGLAAGTVTTHTAARQGHRGHVEIWPRIVHDGAREPDEWTRPVDVVGEGHGTARLAARIAARIADWIERGETLLVRENGRDHRRAIHAGDVMVLVRARDAFIPALTRELKARRVPVAGTDRLALAQHIAVQDLLALGRTVLMPEDDLSLAAILKSPFWSVSEDELYRLARPRDDAAREGTLYDRMRELAAHDGKMAHALAEIDALRERAGRVPVHEFYAHLLGPMGGRARVFARLGHEAEDVLDAFLQAALDHEEAGGAGGLQGFVEAMSASGAEVKREMEGHAREVRIMTVHAAKGLQAPVVFVVDKGSAPFNSGQAPKLLHHSFDVNDPGAFVWVPSAARVTPAVQPLRERDEAETLAEYRRLLYVAMTRAADRLVVCGYCGGKDGEPTTAKSQASETWHEMVSRALVPACDAVPCDFGGGTGDDGGGTIHRFPRGAVVEAGPAQTEPETVASPRAPMPAHILSRLAAEPDVPRPLTPAGSLALVDGAALRGGLTQSLLAVGEGGGGPGSEMARRRGTLAHRLLQALPDVAPAERREVAMRFLRGTLRRTPEPDLQGLADEVLAVMATLDPAFGPDSRAEVALRGLVQVDGEEVMLSGQIDRLVVADRITILDFKTGRDVPEGVEDVPLDYVRQLAIYRALVRAIWDRPVTAMLVWTHAAGGPRPMVLDDATLEASIAGSVA